MSSDMTLHVIRLQTENSESDGFGVIVTPFIHPAKTYPIARARDRAQLKSLLTERLLLQEEGASTLIEEAAKEGVAMKQHMEFDEAALRTEGLI